MASIHLGSYSDTAGRALTCSESLEKLREFVDISTLREECKEQISSLDAGIISYDSHVASISAAKCVIKTSPLHGNGLFADQDLQVGEVVTFYPAHTILYSIPHRYLLQKRHDAIDPLLRVSRKGEAQKDEEYSKGYTLLTQKATVRHQLTVSIVGYGDEISDRRLCGHIANDPLGPIKLPEGDDVSDLQLLARSAVHSRVALAKANVKVDFELSPFAPTFTTTKAVKEGEEIVWFYGLAYWLGKAKDENSARLMGLLQKKWAK